MSRRERFTLGLTLLNFALLVVQFLSQASTALAKQSELPVLRGSKLEIVDPQGRVRAQILTHGPETVNGITYPEAVLFRMMDPHGGPLMKMTVAPNGSGFGLSDGINGGNGGLSFYARDTATFIRIVDRFGKTQVLKP